MGSQQMGGQQMGGQQMGGQQMGDQQDKKKWGCGMRGQMRNDGHDALLVMPMPMNGGMGMTAGWHGHGQDDGQDDGLAKAA